VSEVHRTAAAGFSASAGDYERARPEYPPEAVEFVLHQFGLQRGSRVLDLAAGTGKLTRLLAEAGMSVLAVEPLAEMRERIGEGIEAVEGTAETVPAPDGVFDAVTVAQAFHWFDGDKALAEIHRVLRPGGGLALVWNRRTKDARVWLEVDEIIDPYRRDTPNQRTGRWRDAFDTTTLFTPLEETLFDNSQELNADGLAARVGSTSFISALPDEERLPVLDRIRAVAGDGPVTLDYTTEVYTCRRA
jgi:SAM-dependent methyltransferase